MMAAFYRPAGPDRVLPDSDSQSYYWLVATTIQGTQADERRPYRSSRRDAQARATRAAILDSARRLFAARGYASTTREAIAREADVAVQTVGAVFGTKRALLDALLTEADRADGSTPPPALRSWVPDLRDQADAASLLRHHAASSRAVSERTAALTEVVRRAAAADPDIAELWDTLQRRRHRGQATVVELVEARGPLRAGLTRSEAADVLWTLTDDALYHALVVERAWPAERFDAWLGDAMRSLLLGD
jgi:AcrR family transcriptional regulator